MTALSETTLRMFQAGLAISRALVIRNVHATKINAEKLLRSTFARIGAGESLTMVMDHMLLPPGKDSFSHLP